MSYKINLSETDPKGNFPCPSCGQLISPDNLSEKTYKVQEAYYNDSDLILVIVCSCGAVIDLICEGARKIG